MPNVAWQEPQILADLLAINLFAQANAMRVPGPLHIALVSPWISDVELAVRPGPWFRRIGIGDAPTTITLSSALRAFASSGWLVEVAVLAYGLGPPLPKDPAKFGAERELLRQIRADGASVFLVPGLHAKGVVTPFGVITGSTNLTFSGMFVQSQNANYFPHDHPDYALNCLQLRSQFSTVSAVAGGPL